MRRAMTRDARRRVATLTPREREIVALMADGLSNAAVGQALWLSQKTVETHVRAILSKLAGCVDEDRHRRVVAVLVYLAATAGDVREPCGRR